MNNSDEATKARSDAGNAEALMWDKFGQLVARLDEEGKGLYVIAKVFQQNPMIGRWCFDFFRHGYDAGARDSSPEKRRSEIVEAIAGGGALWVKPGWRRIFNCTAIHTGTDVNLPRRCMRQLSDRVSVSPW